MTTARLLIQPYFRKNRQTRSPGADTPFSLMQKYLIRNFIFLLERLGVVLLLFVISRALFFILNRHLFEWIDLPQFAGILFLGLRFDMSGVVITNALFILLVCLPMPFVTKRHFQKLLFLVFMITNGAAFLVNSSDIIYYRFINKRSTSDLFSFIFSNEDVLSFVPRYFIDFWHITLIYTAILVLLFLAYRHIPKPSLPERLSWKFYPTQTLIFLLAILLSILAIRGGIQSGPPISLITAANMVGTQNVSLAVNTPFTMYRTIGKTYIKEKNYFTPENLQKKITPVHWYDTADKGFDNKNVVVIIMESFSREYLAKPIGNEGLTPFLDALIPRGLFFQNAYANAKRSQDAIPGILASIPSLLDNAYISSVYSSNTIDSLASTLGQKGYRTSFFHGGQTGTMGFDSFCGAAGFQEYYGMADYTDKKHFDGDWGIFDEPFFQFFAQKLSKSPEPFFSVFFTLTSHHPYPLPERYKTIFKEGKHPIFKTIQYADYALQTFFDTAKKMPWFHNTLFVITADHTMYGQSSYYKTDIGKYAIPLLFYSPSDTSLKGISIEVTQQLDIMPSVLHYLSYDKPFFSFGKSVFDMSKKGFSISYNAGIYQYIHGNHVLHFDGEKSLALYDFKNDLLLENNLRLSEKKILKEMEENCMAVIQAYHHALLNNKMSASTTE